MRKKIDGEPPSEPQVRSTDMVGLRVEKWDAGAWQRWATFNPTDQVIAKRYLATMRNTYLDQKFRALAEIELWAAQPNAGAMPRPERTNETREQ